MVFICCASVLLHKATVWTHMISAEHVRVLWTMSEVLSELLSLCAVLSHISLNNINSLSVFKIRSIHKADEDKIMFLWLRAKPWWHFCGNVFITWLLNVWESLNSHYLNLFLLGRVPRAVASVNQHLLSSDDVVSCCLDLGVPSISFRINGQPVQGMFENFCTEGFFFPVVSLSAGVK